MAEIIAEWKKILVAYIAKLCFLPFHIFRIKKNRIMFTSLTGGNYMEYSCNPKYIYECLKKQTKDNYEIIWAVRCPEKYQFFRDENVRLVTHFSIRCFFYLLTSNVVITNGSYVPWVTFRKKQTVINTWHGGGAYKKLDTGEGYLKHLIDKRNALAGKNTGIFVTSSEEFCRYVIRGAFHFKGKVLHCGMPRNDFLVNGETDRARKNVEEGCGISSEKKILLYAPTYRKNETYEKLDLEKTVLLLKKVTGQEWACLERLHRYETDGDMQENSYVKDVNEYPDMQELLGAADMLITDYSSSIWDYSFLNRPCFLYVPDLERYRKMRGFYEDIDKWQYPYAVKSDELYDIIGNMERYDWYGIARRHHDMLKSCETGEASETVVKYIESICR